MEKHDRFFTSWTCPLCHATFAESGATKVEAMEACRQTVNDHNCVEHPRVGRRDVSRDVYDRGAYGQPAPVLRPADVRADAKRMFTDDGGLALPASQFYASWAAYDASLNGMSEGQRILQQRAEVLDLSAC